MSFETSKEYLKSVCSDMYERIKDEIRNSNPTSSSFHESKEFYLNRSTTSTEVVTNQLFATLLNHLMKEAANTLEGQSIATKNAFYEYDFRNIMDEWRHRDLGVLSLIQDTDISIKDPRIIVTTCATGSVFILWLAFLLFMKTKSFTRMAIKISLAIVSVFTAYFVSYKSSGSVNRMHASLKEDVIKILDENEQITYNWLERALQYFQYKFDEFSTTKNIDIRR